MKGGRIIWQPSPDWCSPSTTHVQNLSWSKATISISGTTLLLPSTHAQIFDIGWASHDPSYFRWKTYYFHGNHFNLLVKLLFIDYYLLFIDFSCCRIKLAWFTSIIDTTSIKNICVPLASSITWYIKASGSLCFSLWELEFNWWNYLMLRICKYLDIESWWAPMWHSYYISICNSKYRHNLRMLYRYLQVIHVIM